MTNVLKGEQWRAYLASHPSKSYLEEYVTTHNHVQIYKRGEYYYSFELFKGYKNIASLKRLI